MIYDCVLLRDELDLLEARLHTYADIVDVVVVVEGTHLFGSGQRRDLCDLSRFDHWGDRLRRVVIDLTACTDAWDRERLQRDGILYGITDAAPDDVVWIGDIDEFPSLEQAALHPQRPVGCRMRHMVAALNLEHPERHTCTVIARRCDIDTPETLRQGRPGMRNLVDGGFHFSWLPNRDGWAAKSAATAHTEFAHIDAGEAFARHEHVTGIPLQRVEPDDTWPAWFAENDRGWWA